ncbi:MAG: hypothetical protein R3C53_14865 [Pirellulaceae bacterium]
MKRKQYFRMICAVALLAVPVGLVACSPGRPDPRANPDFNEASYKDPNLALEVLKPPK